MSQNTKIIVIVDGYSTARELVAELNLLGATCIHVRSVETPPMRLAQAFDPKPYAADLGYLGSCAEAAAALKAHKPSAVVAGSEPGVEYAEELAAVMGLPTNDPAIGKARRNKQLMIEQIAAAGLLCARQHRVTTEAEAVEWAQLQDSWPIVIKPLESAGSDGVTICRSIEEIGRAVRRAIGKGNLLGIHNTALLAQTYLDGPQFFVNTVSRDGVHRITDAWEMRNRDVPGYANAMEDWILVDPEQPEIKDLFDYTLSAVTALGFRNGAAVSEVRLTSRGPALIETGARLNGPTMERAPYLTAGLKGTQATALAESLVDPARFAERWCQGIAFTRPRAIAKSFFIFRGDGVVAGVSGLEVLKDFPSWHSMYRPLAAGDRVALTTDTVGRGGVVYWLHDDIGTLLSDLRRFRDLDDANGLYEVDYARGAAA